MLTQFHICGIGPGSATLPFCVEPDGPTASTPTEVEGEEFNLGSMANCERYGVIKNVLVIFRIWWILYS